jgi:quinol monooxygenase YgiN
MRSLLHRQQPSRRPRGTGGALRRATMLAMIIVSGSIDVDPAERDAYLAGCREVIEAARKAEGCLDFHLSPDPIEADRINVYEQWESVAAVEAFRGAGPSSEQAATIRDARVFQHEVAGSTKL